MIDGNKLPIMNGYKLKSIIKGDQKVPEISKQHLSLLKFLEIDLYQKCQKISQNTLGIKIQVTAQNSI